MFSFTSELDQLSNSPFNLIQREVKQYMAGEEYNAYTKLIFPLDRAMEIHSTQFQRVVNDLLILKEQTTHDNNGHFQLNSLLMPVFTDIHLYLSAQRSLFDILMDHSKRHGLSEHFRSGYHILMNSNIAKFFVIYRDNILNEFNFSPVLQFNSGKGYEKLVYRVADWLALEECSHLRDFVTSMGEVVVIDNLIQMYHDSVCDFLRGYQTIVFKLKRDNIEPVISTLMGFDKKYEAIGQHGYLPVSRSYLETKLREINNAQS